MLPPILEARRVAAEGSTDVTCELLRHLVRRSGSFSRVYVSFVRRPDGSPVLSPPLQDALRELGFSPTARLAPKMTRLVPLSGPVDLSDSAWKGVRRQARAMEKFPVELRPITDPAWADRMRELKIETYRRSGGCPPPADYRALCTAAAASPDSVHLIGCFRTDRSGFPSLVGWDFATCDGALATAELGARGSEVINGQWPPSGYWTLLACIDWAGRRGARFFDLGGITAEDAPNFAQLRGVNEFKARFGGTIVPGFETEFVVRTRVDRWLSKD